MLVGLVLDLVGRVVHEYARVASDALIFVCGPCSAGKNSAWISAGLQYLSFAATSRVSRKYGSWSIAHGMRHGILEALPKICGKELEKEGAAWMDAKWILPMLSLYARVRVRGGVVVSGYPVSRMHRTPAREEDGHTSR